MRDRTGKDLPVKNRCTFCYNTIYNPSPLSLLGQEHLIHRLAPDAIRLQFTWETKEQIRQIVQPTGLCSWKEKQDRFHLQT